MPRQFVKCPCCLGRLYFDEAIDDLCCLFVLAAWNAWSDLGDSDRLGVNIGEDSITDMLLLGMARGTKHVAVKRYTRHKEHETGGDWLWWFVSGTRGFPVLIQAKRLFGNGRYDSLKYKEEGNFDQTSTLIEYAAENGWLPLFCFYNFPYSTKGNVSQLNLFSDPCWGCAVAPAEQVENYFSKYGRGANKASNIVSISTPWSDLVCDVSGAKLSSGPRNLPDRVRASVIANFGLVDVPDVADTIPDWVQSQLVRPTATTGDRGLAGDVIAFAVEGQHLDETRGGFDLAPPAEFNFLKGVIVVSEALIEPGAQRRS